MDGVRSQPGAAPAAPTWPAPGPGTWVLDAGHVPRPLCRFTAWAMLRGAPLGFDEGFARFGTLVEHFDPAVVGGFLYQRMVPVGAPPDAAGTPPEPVFRRQLHEHPLLRERVATAEVVLAERRWREALREWDEEVKPALLAQHRALSGVDLSALDDVALADHVDRCAAALIEGYRQHHRYTVASTLPVGDYVVHTVRWTGSSPAEALACLSGASPVTEGAPGQLADLVAALREDAEAAALVRDPAAEPDAVLAWLLHRTGPVGERAGVYLEAVAALPVDGEDAVAEPGSLEAPGLVLDRIRGALAPDRRREDTAAAEAQARVRGAVPAESREAFDELLAEARLVYRLRDERAVHGDRLMGSAARAALLEVGRRLARRGLIGDAEDAVDLEPEEVRSLLTGGDSPSREEVAERVRWRRTATYRDMPPFFGPPPGEPLPAAWLPAAAARIHEAVGFAVTAVLRDAARAPEGRVLHGLGVSSGSYEGTARVVTGAGELSRIQVGDVLVAPSTGPAFNLVLPRLGALVTDRGGLLSHAAIVAREFGIPAVVGCSDASEVVPDGARVRVDGAAGTVTVR